MSLVTTHDDAATVLYYAVPGATVTLSRPDAESRGYAIATRRRGPRSVRRGHYELPVSAADLREAARNLADATL